DGTSAVQYTDGQQHKAFAQRGCVQGQGQPWLGPVTQKPAQQGGEASLDRQLRTLVTAAADGLAVGGQIPLAQAAADGEFGLFQPVGHVGGDAVQGTATGQDHAEGPVRQPFELWLAQSRKGLRQFLRPNGQGVSAKHGASPSQPEGCLPSGWGKCLVLTSPLPSRSYG